MSGRGRCISCQAWTAPIAGAGSGDQNDKRESHLAEAALQRDRVGYAVESAKGDVLVCATCLPALIAEGLRKA